MLRDGARGGRIEMFADSFPVFDKNGSQSFYAKPLGKSVGTFEMFGVFSVILNESRHILHHVLMRFNNAQ